MAEPALGDSKSMCKWCTPAGYSTWYTAAVDCCMLYKVADKSAVQAEAAGIVGHHKCCTWAVAGDFRKCCTLVAPAVGS